MFVYLLKKQYFQMEGSRERTCRTVSTVKTVPSTLTTQTMLPLKSILGVSRSVTVSLLSILIAGNLSSASFTAFVHF